MGSDVIEQAHEVSEQSVVPFGQASGEQVTSRLDFQGRVRDLETRHTVRVHVVVHDAIRILAHVFLFNFNNNNVIFFFRFFMLGFIFYDRFLFTLRRRAAT